MPCQIQANDPHITWHTDRRLPQPVSRLRQRYIGMELQQSGRFLVAKDKVNNTHILRIFRSLEVSASITIRTRARHCETHSPCRYQSGVKTVYRCSDTKDADKNDKSWKGDWRNKDDTDSNDWGKDSDDKDSNEGRCSNTEMTDSTGRAAMASLTRSCIELPNHPEGSRCWWTHVPVSVKRSADVKVPLVIDMHGGELHRQKLKLCPNCARTAKNSSPPHRWWLRFRPAVEQRLETSC